MKNWLAASLALVAMAGCASKNPEAVDLEGTWKHTAENGISGGKDEETFIVAANGNKFNITTQTGTDESKRVYDGQTLYSKSPYDETARTVKETEISSERFWANAMTQGSGEAGGIVAGRDAMLYQVRQKRPDGELTQQIWVDAKTGVMLKSTLTIYSSQINSMVRKEDWECLAIDFSPVEDTAFSKP